MKNLTHYFKSPKEDESENESVKKSESPNTLVEEKSPPKKKINLSKSKKKAELTKEKPKSVRASNDFDALSPIESKLPEKRSNQKNKRKLQEDTNTSNKKFKSKSFNKCGESSNVVSDKSMEVPKGENNMIGNKNEIFKINKTVPIVCENSSSCDEPLVRVSRKRKKKLFEDSDEELPEPVNSNELVEVNENITGNVTSRNSLFSYFNKVDKDTALNQRSSISKIEVKALVHSSPNGEIVKKKVVGKINIKSKAKRIKRKSQLYDSIDVLSSEEIIDENNPINVNVSLEGDNKQKNSSSTNSRSSPIESQPTNLASIFKKNGQLNNAVKTILSTGAENEHLTGQTTKLEAKEDSLDCSTKELCESNSRSKTKKSFKNKKSASNKKVTEKGLNDVSRSRSDEKKVLPVSKNSLSQKKIQEKTESINKKNVPVNSKQSVNIPKNTMGLTKSMKTPDKPTFSTLKNSNKEESSPKNKTKTLNGFFSSKVNHPTDMPNRPPDKSLQSPNNARSPWIMKVRLNSASKVPTTDSDDDNLKYSEDSGKGDSEPYSCSQYEPGQVEKEEGAKQTLDEVIVIDDDKLSPEAGGSDGKRTPLRRNAKRPKPNTKDEEDEVEFVEVKPPTPKPSVKMWPFFQKGGARQSKEPIDEAKLKAKMLFLESGVPESIKRKVESVKCDPVAGSPAPFPTFSHVLQADKQVNSRVESQGFRLPPFRPDSPPPTAPAWTSIADFRSPKESEIPVFERPKNVKSFLEKLKEEEPKTDAKLLYKKLKEYKSKSEANIWTEVYKPTNSADMVGNTENVKKLKTWLETLKNCRKREGSVSSGDEFVSEESDGEDNNSFNNMAIISGPCGCGKTTAVYAIANELDIKVLEINASCNRSGKRILAEFSESTQSHHVERSQPIHGFFNNQGSGKKKKKKTKKLNQSKSEKTSLILVEDADLLFADCDEGFVSALASLAASSKRPIVLVTNQSQLPHLDRFNNSKLLRVSFNRPRPSKLSLWLRLLALVEGVVMPADVALRLVTVANCDVRKCLLQLQLMITCNNSEVQDKVNVNKLWWTWPEHYQLKYELPTLLEPEEEEATPGADKAALSKLEAVANTARRLAQLDLLSVNSAAECVEDQEDPCPLAWAARWRDSTALTPSTAEARPSAEAEWLQQTWTRDHQPGFALRTGQTSQEARWLSILRQGEQLFLPGISSAAHTNHQSVTCDYFPALRELGRAEQVRLVNYTRRANRFFNYLQGLGIHASKSYRDFMCDAFS